MTAIVRVSVMNYHHINGLHLFWDTRYENKDCFHIFMFVCVPSYQMVQLVGFYSVSTLVGYSMRNPLFTHTHTHTHTHTYIYIYHLCGLPATPSSNTLWVFLNETVTTKSRWWSMSWPMVPSWLPSLLLAYLITTNHDTEANGSNPCNHCSQSRFWYWYKTIFWNLLTNNCNIIKEGN